MTDNISRVESFYRDPSTLADFIDPAVEWFTMPGIPYGGVHRGADQVRENVLSRVQTDWQDFRSTPDMIFPAGDDCVIGLGRYSGLFKATGKRLRDCDFAHVFFFEHGKLVRLKQYVDSAVFNAVMS